LNSIKIIILLSKLYSCRAMFLSRSVYFSSNWKSRETVPVCWVSVCPHILMYWPKFYKSREFVHIAELSWMKKFHQLITASFFIKIAQWSLKFEILIRLSQLGIVESSCLSSLIFHSAEHMNKFHNLLKITIKYCFVC
jgi:hypothetical protein